MESKDRNETMDSSAAVQNRNQINRPDNYPAQDEE